MVITIKDENSRFGVRVATIIFNHDKTKIFMQRQGEHDYYMFPGGRLEVGEESLEAIKRELIEELGIKEDVKLKYIGENHVKFPNLNYHEIGFYYVTTIDEEKYNYLDGNEYHSLDEAHDGKSIFKWIDIKNLDNYNIMPNIMKEKLKTMKDDSLEHFIYREK